MILTTFWEWFIAPFKKGQYELSFLDEMQIFITIVFVIFMVVMFIVFLLWLDKRR